MFNTKYLSLLLILPLFTVALSTGYMNSVYAASPVCGDRLCSEIPGGRAAWESDPWGAYYGDRDEEHMDDDEHMKDHDDEHMKDGEHMDHDDEHMKDHDREHMDHDDEHMKDHDDEHMKDHDREHMDHDDEHMKDGEHMDHEHENVLKLSRANVEVTFPLLEGYYNGEPVHHIITEASGMEQVDSVVEHKLPIQYAPILGNAPQDSIPKSYFIKNANADEELGYIPSIFTTTPAQPETYSALSVDIHALWNDGVEPRKLTSEQEILDAVDAGEMTLENTGVVMNMPHIVWPGGQMMVKDDKTVDDHTPYTGGQITDIDMEERTVTFIAHRGWGPDGRTVYYIVTDLIPDFMAEAVGAVYTPTTEDLLVNPAAVDLFQFTNGLKGTGPLGAQPGIASAALGDENYSPMWRIHLITWNDPSEAVLLETMEDINFYRDQGMITVELAMPMGETHIVNCPFIDLSLFE